MVVKSPVSLNIGFTPLRNGGFLNLLLGVFAALRQSLLDAQHYRDVAAAYAKNPRGMKRPDFDPSLDALQPVINRQIPVVMRADSKREIERALDLAKEFKLKLIIAGGSEAYTLVDRLKADNVPVLLSVDYPKRAAQAADADPERRSACCVTVCEKAPKSAAALGEGRRKVRVRVRKYFYVVRVHGKRAARSRKAGSPRIRRSRRSPGRPPISLARATGSARSRRARSRILTITRGDLFDRSGRVSQLFVDLGRPVAVHAQTVNGAAAATASGNWNVVATLDGADHPISVSLQQDGVRLTGTYQGALGAGGNGDQRNDRQRRQLPFYDVADRRQPD